MNIFFCSSMNEGDKQLQDGFPKDVPTLLEMPDTVTHYFMPLTGIFFSGL